MKVLEHLHLASDTVSGPQFANLVAATLFVFFPIQLLSQALSVELVEELIPQEKQISDSDVLSVFGYEAYDFRQVEALGDLARQQQELGGYSQSLGLLKQALHVARINNGLYHESQFQILQDIIASEIALQDWEEVDDRYSYMEFLYRRLYQLDDPRLERGLREVSSWHVNALNVNLDGRRVEHLRKASKIFKLRLQIAEKTLSFGDPRFDFLVKNIEICERQLYLASDLNKEMNARRRNAGVDEFDSRRASLADRD